MPLSLNTDLKVKNKIYHIQTEDCGWANPVVISYIFLNGKLLKRVKHSYLKIVDEKHTLTNHVIQSYTLEQHNKTISELKHQSFFT